MRLQRWALVPPSSGESAWLERARGGEWVTAEDALRLEDENARLRDFAARTQAVATVLDKLVDAAVNFSRMRLWVTAYTGRVFDRALVLRQLDACEEALREASRLDATKGGSDAGR
jgi:hypothetical protein